MIRPAEWWSALWSRAALLAVRSWGLPRPPYLPLPPTSSALSYFQPCCKTCHPCWTRRRHCWVKNDSASKWWAHFLTVSAADCALSCSDWYSQAHYQPSSSPGVFPTQECSNSWWKLGKQKSYLPSKDALILLLWCSIYTALTNFTGRFFLSFLTPQHTRKSKHHQINSPCPHKAVHNLCTSLYLSH